MLFTVFTLDSYAVYSMFTFGADAVYGDSQKGRVTVSGVVRPFPHPLRGLVVESHPSLSSRWQACQGDLKILLQEFLAVSGWEGGSTLFKHGGVI